eukprot:9490080-Pyramimonas_sp.AAC.1
MGSVRGSRPAARASCTAVLTLSLRPSDFGNFRGAPGLAFGLFRMLFRDAIGIVSGQFIPVHPALLAFSRSTPTMCTRSRFWGKPPWMRALRILGSYSAIANLLIYSRILLRETRRAVNFTFSHCLPTHTPGE